MDFWSLEFWVAIAHWLTGIGTIILAIAIFKTFKHLVVTNMSKIETEYRLRPWIGPITGIKNFGDLPASGVKAKSIISTTPLSKESLKKESSEFNLGPLLPHMEKSYWFFVDNSVWDNVSNGDASMFVAIYFEYPSMIGSNGYVMISEYNKNNQTFVHKEMWIDYPQA